MSRLQDTAPDALAAGHVIVCRCYGKVADLQRRLPLSCTDESRLVCSHEGVVQPTGRRENVDDLRRHQLSIMIVRLHMHIQAHGIRDQVEGLFEDEKPFTGEGGVEPAAGVQGKDFCCCQSRHTAAAVAGSVHRAVVDQEQPAIGTAVHVELDALHAKTNGLGEGDRGVLRMGAGGASVRDDRERSFMSFRANCARKL